MDFLTEDLQKEHKFTPEQIAVLKPLYDNDIASQKKEWDKLANTNAENILAGAAKYAKEKFGVSDERQQGEKYGDYLNRIADKGLEAKKAEVETAKAEYDKKLKEFKGDEATKAELDAAKSELDKAKQTLANYDEIKGKAEKYDQTSEELKGMKLDIAFRDVKPNFPETVNAYEAKAKWDEFKKGVLEKYTIELVDGVAMAIDKENQYKTVKLSDLAAADKNLEELTKGRQQQGTGAKPQGKDIKIDGLAFEVPDTAKTDTKERAKVIKEQLAKENIQPTDPRYSVKFAEYNSKIMTAK